MITLKTIDGESYRATEKYEDIIDTLDDKQWIQLTVFMGHKAGERPIYEKMIFFTQHIITMVGK